MCVIIISSLFYSDLYLIDTYREFEISRTLVVYLFRMQRKQLIFIPIGDYFSHLGFKSFV